jgi:hypothetical protein
MRGRKSLGYVLSLADPVDAANDFRLDGESDRWVWIHERHDGRREDSRNSPTRDEKKSRKVNNCKIGYNARRASESDSV